MGDNAILRNEPKVKMGNLALRVSCVLRATARRRISKDRMGAAIPPRHDNPASGSYDRGRMSSELQNPSDPAPALSVTMAVLNAERYLAQAVESVLRQSFADFEFIIIDDGSTDRSPAILREFAGRDARIRVISRPTQGIPRTRNEALRASRGEFIAIMDADDIAGPDRFAKQLAYLQAHPECLALGSVATMIDADGDAIRDWPVPLTNEEIDRAYMERRGPAMVNPAAMMRRQAALDIGGYREHLQWCEDQDLFMRLAEVGEVANLAEPLLQYRQHIKSTCHADRQRCNEAVEVVLRDACSRRGIAFPPLKDGDKSWRPPSVADHHRTWGWQALNAGNLATARKHALRAMRRAPLSPQSWRLALCAMRGH
jgi:hypothetical protein